MSASNSNQIEIAAYTEAAPLPPEPRHCIRSQDSGVNASKKPAKPLRDDMISLCSKLSPLITNSQRRWVAKCLAKISSHIALRGEVKLFKELLSHYHTSGSLQFRELSLPERISFYWCRHGVVGGSDGCDYVLEIWYK
jgi:hypothetical protein